MRWVVVEVEMLLRLMKMFLFDRSMKMLLTWFMFGLKIFLTKWPKIAKSLGPAQFWAFGMTCLAPMFLA